MLKTVMGAKSMWEVGVGEVPQERMWRTAAVGDATLVTPLKLVARTTQYLPGLV